MSTLQFCIRESYNDSRIKYYYHPTCFNLQDQVENININRLGTTIFESILLSDMAGESIKECFHCETEIS